MITSLVLQVVLGSAVATDGGGGGEGWADRHLATELPRTMVVTGTPELSPRDAWRAAELQLAERERLLLGDVAERVTSRRAPSWLPGFVVDRVVDGWIRGAERGDLFEIVDHADRVRDHGFGTSHQTHLLIREREDRIARSERYLERRLGKRSRLFLVGCGGAVGLWALCGLLYAWLDRLTRGYMTWRLRAIFGSVGLAVPGLAFLFL